jgi:cytochrome c-type biogenesis protein CcmH
LGVAQAGATWNIAQQRGLKMSIFSVLLCAVLTLVLLVQRQRLGIIVPILLIALACAGYWHFGNPSLAAKPASIKPVNSQDKTDVAALIETLKANPENPAGLFVLAGALEKAGRRVDALEALALANRLFPREPNFWIQRGEMLVRQGGGRVNPAARLAFDRAAMLDPAHPAPRYMLALAWVQAGKPQEAKPILEKLLMDAPRDAPWRPQVERLLRGVNAMIAAGVGGGGPE